MFNRAQMGAIKEEDKQRGVGKGMSIGAPKVGKVPRMMPVAGVIKPPKAPGISGGIRPKRFYGEI